MADPPIDFMWEREWRIRIDELRINPSCARVVVPSHDLAEALQRDHDREQDDRVEWDKLIIGNLAEMLREEFPWKLVIIAEL